MIAIRKRKCSLFCRATDTLCTLLVLLYILFDVLDVDGSNLAKVFSPSRRTAVEAFIPAESDFEFSARHIESLGADTFFIAAVFVACAVCRQAKPEPFSPLRAVRDHGDRLGLARNSLSDTSPYH